MLSKEGNSALSIVNVELGHVKVVNEIDKFLFSRGTKLFTSNFLKELLQLDLKICGISIVREVDELIVEVLRKLLNN